MQLRDQLFYPVTVNHANGTGTAGGGKQRGAVVGFEVAGAPCDGACSGGSM